MFCLLAVFKVTELLVILPNKPNVAPVSMFMQLISAPESNKHDKNKPSIVYFEHSTLCCALVDSEHLGGIFAAIQIITLQVVNQYLLPKFWELPHQLPV